MIYLNTNSTNRVILTLNERSLLTGTTNYIFSLTNQSSNINKLFLATDVSTSTCRYNEFNITVTGTTTSANTVNLTDFGRYNYKVYESTGTTLNITNLNELESGMMFLTGSTLATNKVTYTGYTNNKIVYNKYNQ
jgi:hypothetical protein